jgi:hypothetical protein
LLQLSSKNGAKNAEIKGNSRRFPAKTGMTVGIAAVYRQICLLVSSGTIPHFPALEIDFRSFFCQNRPFFPENTQFHLPSTEVEIQ